MAKARLMYAFEELLFRFETAIENVRVKVIGMATNEHTFSHRCNFQHYNIVLVTLHTQNNMAYLRVPLICKSA